MRKFQALALMGAIIALGASLSGCGTVNAWVGGVETQAASDYAGAKTNLQKADDLYAVTVIDQACNLKLGALARLGTTNPRAVAGILQLCPIPDPNKTVSSSAVIYGAAPVPTPTAPPAAQ